MSPRKSSSAGPQQGGAGAPPAPDLLFVDALEGDKARLMWGVEAFDVPAGLLPAGTREGAWLRVSLSPAASPPDEGGALREKLSRDDDGGDIKL